MEPSDESLCRRVAGKDEAAFEVLVGRYQQRAYRLAWSVLRDAEEARDLAQEAFLRVYQSAGTFDGRAKFSTWFYRILLNACLDHKRKHKWWRRVFTRPGEDDDGADPVARVAAPTTDPVERLDREQIMKRLTSEVERLSPQQRGAVVLQLEGLATSEIAEVLNCSEATVRVHLHRALATLRKTCISTAT